MTRLAASQPQSATVSKEYLLNFLKWTDGQLTQYDSIHPKIHAARECLHHRLGITDINRRGIRPPITLTGDNDFSGLRLGAGNLSFVQMPHALFIDTELKGTFGNHINLQGADFRDAAIGNAAFQFSNLENARFGNAVVYATSFIGSNLRGADFRDAELGYSILGKADARRANFMNTTMKNVNLRGCNLDGAILIGTNHETLSGYTGTPITSWEQLCNHLLVPSTDKGFRKTLFGLLSEAANVSIVSSDVPVWTLRSVQQQALKQYPALQAASLSAPATPLR